MFKFSVKLLTADAWDGIDIKLHNREQDLWARQVWRGLNDQYSKLKEQYKIKGVALKEWLKEYGIGGLVQSKDQVVVGAMREIAKLLDETVKSNKEGGAYRQNEVQAFKNEYGTNRIDWLYALNGQKRSSKSRKVNSGLLE